MVIRDGETIEAPSTMGDLVVLVPGMIIPGDGVLLETEDLSIDESSITGEYAFDRKITYSEAVDQSRID